MLSCALQAAAQEALEKFAPLLATEYNDRVCRKMVCFCLARVYTQIADLTGRNVLVMVINLELIHNSKHALNSGLWQSLLFL